MGYNEHTYIESDVKVKTVEAVYYDGTIKSLHKISNCLNINVVITAASVWIDGISLDCNGYIVKSNGVLYKQSKNSFEQMYIKM